MSRLLQRLNQTESAQDRHRDSRPRINNPAQGRYIRVFHLRNLMVTATTTAAGILCLRRIPTHTVRNRPIRPYVGPVCIQVHRRAHVRWFHILRVWTEKLLPNLVQM